jgi:hypothetical protein
MALALLAGVLLLSGRARAGCDNHAFLKISPVHPNAAFPGKASQDAKGPAPLKGKLPCSGPNCSRGPAQAPAVPVSLTPPAGDQPLWLALVQVCLDPGSSTFLRDYPSLHPIYRSFPIERPPRLSPCNSL